MIWENQLSPAPLPVRNAAKLVDVSKSGYYRWLKHCGRNNRAARDRPVLERIHKIIYEYPGYGYRRMTYELKKHGHTVNHKRVLRLMRENGLTFKRKKWNPITTDSEHHNPVYPNLTKGLKTTGPNQVWAADFTYIQLQKGYVYLAVELDIHTRRCIGWSLSRSLDTNTALDALQMALYNRRNDDIS